MEIVENQILVSGGSGTLGQTLKKEIPKSHFPSSIKFDITDYDQVINYIYGREDIKLLVHCAATINPPKVEKSPMLALETNIIGTCNVVKACSSFGIKLIYISTDYVFDGEDGGYHENSLPNPISKYGYSKLAGEYAVKMYDNSLIVRLSFSKMDFPYDKAFVDQWTSKVTVDKIAGGLKKLIFSDLTGVIHLGGKRKCAFDFAQSISSKTLIEASRFSIDPPPPGDVSLNVNKFNSIFNPLE